MTTKCWFSNSSAMGPLEKRRRDFAGIRVAAVQRADRACSRVEAAPTPDSSIAATSRQAGNGGPSPIRPLYLMSLFSGCGQEVQEVQEVQRMMRLVAGHRRGASSDFGGLFAGCESPDCLVPRAVSRKALWHEAPSETAICCHSFFGLESVSKSRNSEFSHTLRLRTARLAPNGRQAQNCHSACHWLRRTTASAKLGHFDDRLTPHHQCVAAH